MNDELAVMERTEQYDLMEDAAVLAESFGRRAARHDEDGSFVTENFEDLAAGGYLEAGIPAELGGGGLKHREIATILRIIGKECPATALTLSMHQHLVAATRWRWEHGAGGAPLLERVARERISLVSTGATDWLGSSGALEPVDGGFLFSGRKPFCSGSPFGSMIITSAPLAAGDGSSEVLHFAVSSKTEGVTVLRDWNTIGMRGTGSNTIAFENVFIPEGSISLRRPAGTFHPSWSVVLTVAMPLIMSVYLGVAESAREHAIRMIRGKDSDELSWQLAGELENELTVCRVTVEEMVRLANDGDFEPSVERASTILSCKTIAARSAQKVVRKAMELIGGRSYFRSGVVERLLRDVTASQFHPLQEKPQQRFTGRLALGLDPIA